MSSLIVKSTLVAGLFAVATQAAPVTCGVGEYQVSHTKCEKCPAITKQLCEFGRIKDKTTGCDTSDCAEPRPTEVPEPLCVEGTSEVRSRVTVCKGHPTKEEEMAVESCDCERGDWVCMSAGILPDDDYCCDGANDEYFENGKCINPKCANVKCAQVVCEDGFTAFKPDGKCCDECVKKCPPVTKQFCEHGRIKDTKTGCDTNDCACANVKCAQVVCEDDLTAFKPDGKCCDECVKKCPPVTKQFCEHGRIKDKVTGCDTDKCAEAEKPTEVPEPLCEEGTSKVVSSMIMCKGHPTQEEKVTTEWCDCENLDWVCMAADMLPDDEYCCDKAKTGETFENGKCIAPHDCADGKVWNTCGSPCGDMTCSQKEPMPCTAVCEPRCACHEKTPIWDESLSKCVAEKDCSAPPICTAGETKVVSSMTMCQGHPTKQEVVTIESCDCEVVDGGKLDWMCMSASMLSEDEYCCDGETFENGKCKATFEVSGGKFAVPYYKFKNAATGDAVDLTAYTFVKGTVYTFEDVGVKANHPFYVQQTRSEKLPTSANVTGELSLSGDSGKSFSFTLPMDYTGTLVYYCTKHDSMTSSLTIG